MAETIKPEPKPHQPLRTCVGCGAKKPKAELLRIASYKGSTPVIEKCGKASGRGAHLCPDKSCLERAIKRRAFERALRLDVAKQKSTPPATWRAEIEALIDQTTLQKRK